MAQFARFEKPALLAEKLIVLLEALPVVKRMLNWRDEKSDCKGETRGLSEPHLRQFLAEAAGFPPRRAARLQRASCGKTEMRWTAECRRRTMKANCKRQAII